MTTRARIRTGMLLGAVTFLGVTAAETTAPVRHLRLEKSIPGADSVLATAPSHVLLWFSQEPQLRLSGVTLKRTDGGEIALGPLTQCPTEKLMIHARVDGSLPAGRYVVAWRTASSDGHVIRGEIPFRIR